MNTTLKLNNGQEMPVFGLGTWQSQPGEVGNAVKVALDCGYRLLDCAMAYQNQKEIGNVLTEYFKTHDLKRKDIFITSKVWNTFHSYDLALKAVDEILSDFHTDYIDLVLIHWPMGYKEGTGEYFPKDGDKTLYSDVDYLETWKALEKKVEEGKIRSIGVSNFSIAQIKRVLDNCKIKPAVQQVELHPYFQQKELVDFCREQGICVTAYSPLGNPGMPAQFRKGEPPNVFKDEAISELAKKHGKTNAQVVLKAIIQKGIAVIPKSVNEARLQQNADIWDFALTADEMKQFEALDRNLRLLDLKPTQGDHPHFPW